MHILVNTFIKKLSSHFCAAWTRLNGTSSIHCKLIVGACIKTSSAQVGKIAASSKCSGHKEAEKEKYIFFLAKKLIKQKSEKVSIGLAANRTLVQPHLYRQSHYSFHAGACPAADVNRCGSSFSNAASKCVKCPKGVDSECAKGETCYAGLPNCGGGGGGGGGDGGDGVFP
jgi:hypothetical protein